MKITVTQKLPKASTPFRLLLGKLILVFLLAGLTALPVLAQKNILVKGRVLNEKNQPVSNASVLVKGTTNGTTTNENGDFQINAPSDATLVISSIGYGSKEISVN